MPDATSSIDGKIGKICAVIVILACSAALAFINRDRFLGQDQAAVSLGNPELAACLEARVAAVDAMLADAVINEAQYELLRRRAVAHC